MDNKMYTTSIQVKSKNDTIVRRQIQVNKQQSEQKRQKINKISEPIIEASNLETISLTKQSSVKNMKLLDANQESSLRGMVEKVRQREQGPVTQSLTNFKQPSQQKEYIKNHHKRQNSSSPTKTSENNSYIDYLKSQQTSIQQTQHQKSEYGKSHAQSQSKLGVVRHQHLKPSQIVQEAKKDLKFGHRNHPTDFIKKQGPNSLAVLVGYLHQSASVPKFKPTDYQMNLEDAAKNAANQEKIKTVINDRFTYNENSRSQTSTNMIKLRTHKVAESSDQMLLERQKLQSLLTSPREGSNMDMLPNFSSLNTADQAETSNKVYKKYKRNFKSPISQAKKIESHVGPISGNAYNAHSSVTSLGSQSNQAYQYRKIQTMSKLGDDKPSTYVPFLKQKTVDTHYLKGTNSKKSPFKSFNPYPSHKVMPRLIDENAIQKDLDESFGTVPKGQETDESPSPVRIPDKNQAPYKVSLMSVSQSQKQLPTNTMDSQNANAPNVSKLKKERIVQQLERISKRDQQGGPLTGIIKKGGRNAHVNAANTESTPIERRLGSLSSGSRERAKKVNIAKRKLIDPMRAYQGAAAIDELMEPADQVKSLPSKARRIFKKAMKELDQVDLINSDQLPMSRPRIRAILKKMKENVETGEQPQHTSSKNIKEAIPRHQRLSSMGRQAERELFGMLLKDKRDRKAQQKKNLELQQHYEDQMIRQKLEFAQNRQKEENREKMKDQNGYYSASSSEQIEMAQNDHAQFSARQDYAANLLSSDRPSSADLLNPGSITSRKDIEKFNKMRETSRKRKKKQEKMVLEELINLVDKPSMNSTPKTNGFYNKFQNIDKIVQLEDNELYVTRLQECAEQQEIDEDQLARLNNKSKTDHQKQSSKHYESLRKGAYTPTMIANPAKGKPEDHSGKSPIVEYLKQVQKDKLLPHFMPFKKLQEAANSGNNGSGLKYCLDQFQLNSRVAPSIASALKNLQQLSSMSLIDTMLSEDSFMIILNATPKTLVSLNLSQNEHLTAKCFAYLHNYENLAHLTLEKCNIRDETVSLLLDLDPFKLNAVEESLQKQKTRKSPLKKQLTALDSNDDADFEREFVLSGLLKTLKQFNISKNQIADAGAKVISNFIDKSQILETLQLHWNKIRAQGAIYLAKAIKNSETIKIVDVSFNSFGSGACRKALIATNPKLEEEVSQDQRHATAKFEISQSAWKWRKTLMKNSTLMHVDISFNGFTAEDMTALSDGLRENHTLLGCHVEGNNAKIDALGFLHPILTDKKTKFSKQKGKEVYDVHSYDRIPITMENEHMKKPEQNKGQRQGMFGQNPKDSQSHLPNFAQLDIAPRNCWLCEGWTQKSFEVQLPEKFIGVDVSSVYIHLNFEDFKPMVMTLQADKIYEEFKLPKLTKRVLSQVENSNVFPANNLTKNNGPTKNHSIQVAPKAQTFFLNRMVPPSKDGIYYYFSLQNPKNFKREIFFDRYKKKIFVDDELRQKYTPKQNEAAQGEENVESFNFPKFIYQTKPIKPVLRDVTNQQRIEMLAKPRVTFNTQELTRPSDGWTFDISFFAKYKFDNDLVIGKCFDWDWRCSALEKMIKDPHEKEMTIKYLRPKYGLIRETYKHLACVAPAGNMPSIGMNVITELMLKCNDFVDYKQTKLSDVDLAFIATNAIGARSYPFRQEVIINPERQVIRYQFFEILIRLALERCTKTKQSISEGIKVFYEQYMQDQFMKFHSHPWRTQRYWNEDCDMVIKENLTTLNEIYDAFAQAQSPGDPKVLRLTRYIELVTMSGVCDDNFGAREIGPLYNLAMQTNMDEINQTRHMDMRFIEFVEALARVADKAIHHNTQEFPIDRQTTNTPPKGNLSSPSKQSTLRKKNTTKKLASIMASAMDSVIESQSSSPHRNKINQIRSPSAALLPSLPKTKLQSVRQGTDELFYQGIQEEADLNKSAIQIVQGGKLDFNQDIQEDLEKQKDEEDKPRVASAMATPFKPLNQTKDNSSLDIDNTIGTITPSKKVESSAAKKIGQKLRKNISSANVTPPQINSPSISKSRSRSRISGGESGDGDSVTNISAIQGEMHLSEKLQKYINRIAVTCLGQMYATRYIRDWNRKNTQKARKMVKDGAEEADQVALLGQFGLKATLKKERYADQKPPPTPQKKGGRKVTLASKRVV